MSSVYYAMILFCIICITCIIKKLPAIENTIFSMYYPLYTL